MHSGPESPPGVWWKPAHRAEKVWVAIAFAWCMVLFAMMPIMHVKGGQNVSGIRHTVDPGAYAGRVNALINEFQVGVGNGYPVVAPPPGSHVYLMATSFAWLPVLKLEKGVEYILHLSALDVNHGFGLLPLNVNLQIVPGYDYALRVTPTEAGDFRIVCNEFCGIGHHMMVGKVIVTDGPNTTVNPTAMLTGGRP
jgi:cytochrome c oxidase subunit II